MLRPRCSRIPFLFRYESHPTLLLLYPISAALSYKTRGGVALSRMWGEAISKLEVEGGPVRPGTTTPPSPILSTGPEIALLLRKKLISIAGAITMHGGGGAHRNRGGGGGCGVDAELFAAFSRALVDLSFCCRVLARARTRARERGCART